MSSLDLTRDWLRGVLRPYPSRDVVQAEVLRVLQHTPSLAVKTDAFTFDSGSTTLLLLLHGTLPITYKGASYHIPVHIWLPHEYPRGAPMVYVVPTRAMGVRKSRDVEPGGRVLAVTPWWGRGRELDALIAWLVELFSAAPPVYAKPPEQAQAQAHRSSSVASVASTSGTPAATPAPPGAPVLPARPHAHPHSQPHTNGEALPQYRAAPSPPGAPGGGGNPAIPPHVGPPSRQSSLNASLGSASPAPQSPPPPQIPADPQSPPLPLRPGKQPPVPQRPVMGPPKPIPMPLSPASTGWAPEAYHAQPPIPPHPQQQWQRAASVSPPPQLPPMHHQAYQPYPPHQAQQQPPHQQPQQQQQPQPQPHPQPSQGHPYAPQHPQWAPPQPPSGHAGPSGPGPSASTAPAPPPPAASTLHPPARTFDLLSSPELGAAPRPDDDVPPPLPSSKPPPPSLVHLHAILLPHLDASLPPLLHSLKDTTTRLSERREDLLSGAPAIADETARLEAVKKVCDAVGARLEDVVSRGSERVAELEARGDVSVDEVVCSISIVHNQLIDLVAEDNAISDTLYHVTRAFEAERIDTDRYLKAVRALAREQYMKRALIERINEGMGGGAWSVS